MRTLCLAAVLLNCLCGCASEGSVYDVVISGGRVIDPETGLDAIRNVGIRADTIVRVSTEPLRGRDTLDATGLVVAPGFIDLHQHVHSPEGYRILALDGVTTALELETGVPDLQRFMDVRRGQAPIHFGATASHWVARLKAWEAPIPPSINGPEAGIPAPAAGPVTNEPASPERLERIITELRSQIELGALGIGVALEYTPGATRGEIIEVFKLAAEYGLPVFVHVRSAGRTEPGSSIESVAEVIGAAAITGAPAHIVHINSSCLRESPTCLAMIEGAQKRGLDVTTESYPYTAAMAVINSAFFNPGWREKRGIDYSDVEMPESGERLTRERFDVLHASSEPKLVLIHMNPDEVVNAIIANPLVAIASDGLKAHPRGAGTFSRVLARYVRDQGTLSLGEAIRRITLMPAQRLQAATPDAARLGRLQEGARADITVFDARTIQDHANFRAPNEPSVGVKYLIVAGTIVVNGGQLVQGVLPGRPLVGHRLRN